MYENKIVCDYQKGYVSKEDLDACSTYSQLVLSDDGLCNSNNQKE